MDMSLAFLFPGEGGVLVAGSFSPVDFPNLNNFVIRYIGLSTDKIDKADARSFPFFSRQGEVAKLFYYRRIT